MKKENKKEEVVKDLLLYELPTISEFIGNKYLQQIISKYTAWKILKKMARYKKRIKRKQYIENILKKL